MYFPATEMMLFLQAIQILSHTSLWNCCLLLVVRFFRSDRSPIHGRKSFFVWINTGSAATLGHGTVLQSVLSWTINEHLCSRTVSTTQVGSVDSQHGVLHLLGAGSAPPQQRFGSMSMISFFKAHFNVQVGALFSFVTGSIITAQCQILMQAQHYHIAFSTSEGITPCTCRQT